MSITLEKINFLLMKKNSMELKKFYTIDEFLEENNPLIN